MNQRQKIREQDNPLPLCVLSFLLLGVSCCSWVCTRAASARAVGSGLAAAVRGLGPGGGGVNATKLYHQDKSRAMHTIKVIEAHFGAMGH